MPEALRVGIVGAGTIGMQVAREILQPPRTMVLTGFSTRNESRSRAALDVEGLNVPILSVDQLVQNSDVIVEAASYEAAYAIAEAVLDRKKFLVALTAGALLEHWEVIQGRDGRIIVASGAIGGLDLVRAAVRAEPGASVELISSKPPAALQSAPFVREMNIDLFAFEEPTRLFQGSARQAVRAFPTNANVAASLALAGTGPDATLVTVWVHPFQRGNCHRIKVNSEIAMIDISIEAQASTGNPRTSRLAASSALVALDRIRSRFNIGS